MNTLYSFPLDFDKYVNQSNYYWFEEGFTAEELKTLEQQVQEIPSQAGVTETGKQADGEGLESRNSMIKWVPFSEETKWIYDKIGMLAKTANDETEIVIVYSILISVLSDIGGLVIGKIFKGRKLTKISPKKTISGSIGSFVFSLSLLPFFIELLPK